MHNGGFHFLFLSRIFFSLYKTWNFYGEIREFQIFSHFSRCCCYIFSHHLVHTFFRLFSLFCRFYFGKMFLSFYLFFMYFRLFDVYVKASFCAQQCSVQSFTYSQFAHCIFWNHIIWFYVPFIVIYKLKVITPIFHINLLHVYCHTYVNHDTMHIWSALTLQCSMCFSYLTIKQQKK